MPPQRRRPVGKSVHLAALALVYGAAVAVAALFAPSSGLVKTPHLAQIADVGLGMINFGK